MTLLGRLVTLACVLRALTGFAQAPVPAATLAAEATDLAAFQRAVNDAPSDAAALLRLSQAYAAADQPVAALDAVDRAFALSPDSVDILRARGTLATWVADYGRAQDSYRRLGKLQPDDQEVFL